MSLFGRKVPTEVPAAAPKPEAMAAETLRRLERLLATVERLSPAEAARPATQNHLRHVVELAEELERTHLPSGHLMVCAVARDLRFAAEDLLAR